MNERTPYNGKRRIKCNQAGAIAVEFAFIAPILFAIILATIDLGRYAWTLSTIQMAADEAARQGAVQNKTTAQVKSQAEKNLFGMNVSDFTVAATNTTLNGANILRVNIQHTYQFMFPISAWQSSATMNITSNFPKP